MDMFKLVAIFSTISIFIFIVALFTSIIVFLKHKRAHFRSVVDDDDIDRKKKYKKSSIFSAFQIFIAGFFIASSTMYFPALYFSEALASDSLVFRIIKSALLSFNNTLKIFILDGGYDAIADAITIDNFVGHEYVFNIYTTYSSFIHLLAPILTAGVVLIFFREMLARVRVAFHRRSNVYIMSELNERSLALATDIYRQRETKKLELWENEKNPFSWIKKRLNILPALIIFTEVDDKKEDGDDGVLIRQAKDLGAVCIKKSIKEINLRYMKRDKYIKAYFISENETENVNFAIAMIEQCKTIDILNNSYSQFFVFAKGRESEAIIDSLFLDSGERAYLERLNEINAISDEEQRKNAKEAFLSKERALYLEQAQRVAKRKGDKSNCDEPVFLHPKVRRINESRNLAYSTLIEHPIFDYAVEKSGQKHINLVIAGLGGYGTELLKAVCFTSQVKGYKTTVHIFDSENGQDKICSIAPDLVSHSGKCIEGDCQYTLCFHDNTNVTSKDFMDTLLGIDDITGIYVTLGNDDLNIQTAIRARVQLTQSQKYKDGMPPIYSVVYNNKKSHLLDGGHRQDARDENAPCGLVAFDLTPYNITFLGSLEKNFTVDMLEQKELERRAIKCHVKWSGAASGNMFDNEKSFERVEYFRRSSMAEAVYYTIGLKCNVLPKNDSEVLSKYEHIRWNAFMRSDGFTYVEGVDKNYMAKIHKNLVPYDRLSKKDQHKDSTIINDEGVLIQEEAK
ncbi:MAG: hypothetical protein IJ309_01970 [Clostridia bacterium]|nr:hypothetical protein [Clostridia bacterium]